jgi:hypothetical protein
MICSAKPGPTENFYISSKGRIFNNMLDVRYIHFTKAKRSLFIRDKPILSSERILHKNYGGKGSVAEEKSLFLRFEWLGAERNRQPLSKLDFDFGKTVQAFCY